MAAITADQDAARAPDSPRRSHAEIALLRRAGRQRWAVPDEVKAEAFSHLARPLRSPATSARERVRGSAARVSRWAVARRALSRQLDRYIHHQEPTRPRTSAVKTPRR